MLAILLMLGVGGQESVSSAEPNSVTRDDIMDDIMDCLLKRCKYNLIYVVPITVFVRNHFGDMIFLLLQRSKHLLCEPYSCREPPLL